MQRHSKMVLSIKFIAKQKPHRVTLQYMLTNLTRFDKQDNMMKNIVQENVFTKLARCIYIDINKKSRQFDISISIKRQIETIDKNDKNSGYNMTQYKNFLSYNISSKTYCI
jgi:hypothetical protein